MRIVKLDEASMKNILADMLKRDPNNYDAYTETVQEIVDRVKAEGDGCLDNWIKIHTEYYSSLLEKIDKKLTGRTKLVCEWFSVVSSNN